MGNNQLYKKKKSRKRQLVRFQRTMELTKRRKLDIFTAEQNAQSSDYIELQMAMESPILSTADTQSNKLSQKQNSNTENDPKDSRTETRVESPLCFLNLDEHTQGIIMNSSKYIAEVTEDELRPQKSEKNDEDNMLKNVTLHENFNDHPFLQLCKFTNNQNTDAVVTSREVETEELGSLSKKRNLLCQQSAERKRPLLKQKSPVLRKKHKSENNVMAKNIVNKFQLEVGFEEVVAGDTIDGHRIVQIDYFFNELRKISNHESLFSCELNTLKIVSEKRNGLMSEFKIICQLCQKHFTLKSSSVDINKNAVSGMMSAGCGHQQLNHFTAAVDLPSISEYSYNRAHDQVCNEWELTAWAEMKKAGQRERDAAIKEGRVNKDGIAMIDVEVDGSWCKRSYRTNYSASSGTAAIIGRRFGQVLFMCVKNKYCCICARAEKKNETVKEHSCYKNFSGASTAMEANIIVEGFKQSLDMHNLIYSRFVADGDSSTYAKILEARPYPNITVEKINCKNHILRNFCNKLQQLKTDTKYNTKERKNLSNDKILRTRKYITEAMKFHGGKTEETTKKIKSLHKDISLSIYHGFGLHDDCNKEICNRDTETSAEFTTGPLWQKMLFLVANLASHSRSLIENVDSNLVESFNSVIAKFIGGKRINYALRRSYQARCAGAVIDFNTKKILSTVQQNIYQQSPGKRLKKYEDFKFKKRERNRTAPRKRKHYVAPKKMDTDYGESADKPDMDPDTFELSKKLFLENLNKTEEERRDIEKRTVLQSDCGEWMELRRNLLTASNFGKVVKRNVKNSCKNIVKNMLYKANIDHVTSIAHGKKYEKTALSQLSTMLNVEIAECGLFIDNECPFLGATPDGIITSQNKDTIVEIKCPILPYKIGVDEAIRQGKMHFWRYNKNNGEISINKRSDWFIQIQGQLHIAKKEKCVLGVWYGDNKIKTEIIERDAQFWQNIMEPKLKLFYFDCLLPELVDPRFTRNRPIRDPDYVKKNKKNESDKENVDTLNKSSSAIAISNDNPLSPQCSDDYVLNFDDF